MPMPSEHYELVAMVTVKCGHLGCKAIAQVEIKRPRFTTWNTYGQLETHFDMPEDWEGCTYRGRPLCPLHKNEVGKRS